MGREWIMTRYNKPNVMHVQNEVKVHKQKLKLSPKVHYQTLGQSCGPTAGGQMLLLRVL